MQKKGSAFRKIQILTLAAMMAAVSVLIGIFCKSFLNFGNGLFRITFENLPILFSGILLGPIAGGTVGIVSDLVSYLLSPQTYPPNLIVTFGAFSVGFLSGLIARYVIKRHGVLRIVISASVAHAVGSMIIKPLGLYQFYGIAVLLRVPLYLVIAPIEICILCWLLRRKYFQRMIEGR